MIVPEHTPTEPLLSRTSTRTTAVLVVVEHSDPFTIAVPIAPHAATGVDGGGGDEGKTSGAEALPPQLESMNAASVIAATNVAVRQSCRSSMSIRRSCSPSANDVKT
jgi:hypothetical protein